MSYQREELAQTLDQAEWNWLAPHANRNSVIVVSPGLDLLDVGVAIANDNTASVQQWITADLIHKPSPTELSDWNQDQKKRFNALIVQPYVLVQEI
jgi:hypothetical protein